jgi:hypothetical protein
MVFSGTGSTGAPPPAAPAPNSTLVFGSAGVPRTPTPPPEQLPGTGSGTLMFSTPRAESPLKIEALASGTMAFGGTKAVPPSVPGLKPYGSEPLGPPVATPAPVAPPVQAAPRTSEPLPPPVAPPAAAPAEAKTSGTLQFNFDDMVGMAPPPKAVPPPVPPEPLNAPRTAWDKSNPRIDISGIPQGEPGAGGGFDLISLTPPPMPKQRTPKQVKEEVQTLLSGAKDLHDLDDHTGAMDLVAKALELDPHDPDALKLKDRSEKTLQAMYESKLGDLNTIPRVKLKDDEIIWLNLDHRAGFVLAQIDGSVTFEDVFAVSGMSRLDTARILAQLVDEGVINRG